MRLPRLYAREIIGLAVLLAGLGWIWSVQQGQGVPRPPGAAVLSESLGTTASRDTTLRGAWSVAEVRDFYRRELPARGWRYCGNQTTPGCTNMFPAITLEEAEIDVYRRADDTTGTGRTVEIWPRARDGATEVRIFESREQ